MQILQFLLAVIVTVGLLGLAIVTVYHYLRGRRDNQRGVREMEKHFGERLDRLETLERRVGVLEKIVTDRRYDLDEKFRDLDKTG